MQKRGQVVMFMFVGILLLIVFALFLFLYQSDIKFQTSSSKISSQKIAKECLDQNTAGALRQLALQGGLNFANGGTDDISKAEVVSNFNGKTFSTSVGIKKESLRGENAPQYPYEFADKHAYLLTDLYTAFPKLAIFGDVTLPLICAKDGLNDPKAGNVEYSCIDETYDLFKVGNVQDKLKNTIIERTNNCLSDASQNLAQTSDLSSIKVESIDILFASSGVVVFADIKTDNENIVKERSEIPIRFLYTYNILFKLLQQEAHDASFDPTLFSTTCPTFYPPKDLAGCPDDKIQILTQPNGDDMLISVGDDASLIDEQPFVFTTIVKNRLPVVEYIADKLNVKVGDDVIFSQSIIDPDGDSMEVTYSDWKAEVDVTPAGVTPSLPPVNEWELSDTYISGTGCAKGKRVCAKITTTDKDKGTHVVRVTVTDSAGNVDYQDVNVVVS